MSKDLIHGIRELRVLFSLVETLDQEHPFFVLCAAPAVSFQNMGYGGIVKAAPSSLGISESRQDGEHGPPSLSSHHRKRRFGRGGRTVTVDGN